MAFRRKPVNREAMVPTAMTPLERTRLASVGPAAPARAYCSTEAFPPSWSLRRLKSGGLLGHGDRFGPARPGRVTRSGVGRARG